MSVKKGNSLSHRKIDRTALAKRRREAMRLYERGWTQYKIAKKLRVSFEAVSNWVEVYEKNGLKGLESIGRPGPKPLLGEKDKSPRKVVISQKVTLLPSEKAPPSKPTVLGRLFKLIGNK